MYYISFSHSVKLKLSSLSEKIKYFSKKNQYHDSISEIFFEKEKYCLTILIAHIIKSLTFSDKSKNIFLSVIQDYNKFNNKDLKFEDFEKCYWIRIVQDEIVVPTMISSMIYLLKNDKEENNFSEEKRNMLLCLDAYIKTHDKPSITKGKLDNILISLDLKWESIDFLLKKQILEYNTEKSLYYWCGHLDYQSHFRNEISALLWILTKNQFPNTEEAFKRFVYFVNNTDISLQGLYTFLSDDDVKTLYEQAEKYISNEKDLFVCDNEIEKIILDAHSFYDGDLNYEMPFINLKCNTVNELYERFDQLDQLERYEFQVQKTREHIHLVVELILQYEQKQYIEKINIISFFIDVNRPALSFIVRSYLKYSYQYLIPFLVSEIELIPITLKMIDEILLNENIINSPEEANYRYEKEYRIINEIWLELFETVMEHIIENFNNDEKNIKNNQLFSDVLSRIFLYITNKIFVHSYNNSLDIKLNIMQERYTSAFSIFKKSKTKFNIYNKGLYVKSNIYYFLLPNIVCSIKTILDSSKTKNKHFFDFNIAAIDILIDMLQLTIIPYDSIEIDEIQKNKINELLPKSINYICDYLIYYFSAEKMNVEGYNLILSEKDVEIAFDVDNLERTNWALFILFIIRYDLYDNIINAFDSVIKIDKTKTQLAYPNKNQYHRARLMLRILLYSYLQLINEDVFNNFFIKEKEKAIQNLEQSILKYSKMYSKKDVLNNQIDIFYEFSVINGLKYNNTMLHFLFLAINNFSIEKQKIFINDFFENSTDLKRMLIAINALESEDVKNIISNYILQIKIDDFINSCFSVTEWEETLMEAINTESHWCFVEPLISRIKNHYEKRKYSNNQINSIIYQIELSIALRNKNLNALNNIQYQGNHYYSTKEFNPDDIKKYFIARYWLENEKYDNAINIISSLISRNEKNIRYAVFLYKTRFLKYINSEDDNLNNNMVIITAWYEWQKFIDRLNDEGDKINKLYQSEISLYRLPYFIINKDDNGFDNAIKNYTVSSELLYSSKIAKLIYDYYIERGLESEAFQYLNKANEFYIKTGKLAPTIINELIINPDNEMLVKLRNNFKDIITSNYRHIPFITPQNINDKRELRLFILNEIMKSMKKLKDRIKAVGIEDNYTDLIQSILSMRFPFYGWHITEQPHRGKSEAGNRAGEVDLIIQANDEDIALIEALILKGSNFNETRDHIFKSFSYSNRADQYYIIIYYKGEKEKFTQTWDSYKENVKKINFPEDRKLKNNISQFTDLENEFDNIKMFRIAKTYHDNNFEMYHLIADFSE